MTFFGRFMRLGGGGISSVSFERRAKAPDFDNSKAMVEKFGMFM
jgi:hypothetical protein